MNKDVAEPRASVAAGAVSGLIRLLCACLSRLSCHMARLALTLKSILHFPSHLNEHVASIFEIPRKVFPFFFSPFEI